MRHADGTVLTDVAVVNVYWGAWWNTHPGIALRVRQDEAWRTLADDYRLYAPLQEYAPAGGAIHGHYEAGVRGNAMLASGATLSTAVLEAELAREIDRGELPLPSPETTPFYFIYLPPGVDGPPMLIPDGASIPYDAYHAYMTLPGGRRIVYGVAVMPRAGQADPSESLNLAEAHELDETITNPYDDAWRDLRKDENGEHMEVADACEPSTAQIDGHTVQQVWSDRACACVDPPQ